MKIIIPFKLLDLNGEGYHLLIKVKIVAKTANMLIDTGASATVFDKARIEKIVANSKFKKHHKSASGIGTDKMEIHNTVLKKMQIGDLLLTNFKVGVIDLVHVNNSYKQIGLKPIDGVIGSDILKKYNAIIDYKKECLILSKPVK